MNYGSEPADQIVRYSLEGAEFALRISGTAAKNFFIFAQAVLHDSKKTHGKTHLIRLLKEQKPLKFFTVDKDRMHDFARAAKAHGLLFCPIRDKMDPDHIEIAILQDDASKANRIIDKLQLAIVDTGTAELIDTVQQERGETAPETERVQTEDGAVDFEVGADEEQFNMFLPVLCIVLTVVQKCMCTGQAMERGLPSIPVLLIPRYLAEHCARHSTGLTSQWCWN